VHGPEHHRAYIEDVTVCFLISTPQPRRCRALDCPLFASVPGGFRLPPQTSILLTLMLRINSCLGRKPTGGPISLS